MNLISERKPIEGLRTNVGLVMCSAEYASVADILADVDLARRHSATAEAHVSYDRAFLKELRERAQ